jgi:hypothetical protein
MLAGEKKPPKSPESEDHLLSSVDIIQNIIQINKSIADGYPCHHGNRIAGIQLPN